MSDLKASIKRNKKQNNLANNLNRSSLIKSGKSIGPYEVEKLLKEGSSSKVYLAKSKYTGENVVIKALSKSPLKNNLEGLLLITKQLETLKILKHRNIVSLYEIYESPKYFYIITEYLSGKDLIEKIIRKKRFTEEEALRIFFQLLDAMTYMHKMNICHRNIRTEHILFDKNNRPKIIGFGYSTFYESNKKIEGSYGSLCYACPEIIDESPYNPELADVWSLGVILYVLICGYLPFSDDDDNKNKILIENAKIDFPKEISNKLKDLIRHMLDKNPNKRYTFQKIAKHPWLKPYSESAFSGGINVHKIIFPVDERLLNIISQYGFDKEKVKNDLKQNKYNIGTGVYRQIVRKLLDLKMKNISDLCSEEFIEYKDDEKNKYIDGDKKYQDYIKNVDEKYKKKEDFINDFIQREDEVVEKLLAIQQKKESQKAEEPLLDIVEEKNDSGMEDNDDKEEEKDVIDDIENNDNKHLFENIKRQKSHTVKTFNRTRTANYNFKELMHPKSRDIKFFGDNINPDNIEIVYNKDEEVDIIQQFQDEQNKKISENLNNLDEENEDHTEIIKMKKSSSTPNLTQETDSNSNVSQIKKSINLLISPRKTDKNEKRKNTLNDSVFEADKKMKNETLSKFNCNLSNNSLFNDDYKTTKSGNANDKSKCLLRMTSTRKSKKNYLDRGSILDTFLKKNHPDNIRKTMSKENPNIILNDMVEIKEGIKENEESDNDNDNDNDKSDEKEDLKASSKLKYSINFDDDDEDEDENGDNGADNRYSMGDSKLFAMLDNGNENDEELKELKNLYFNTKDKSEEEKNKDEDNKNESKLKEKEKDKEKKDKNINKNTKKEKEKEKDKMEENQKTDRSNGDNIGKKKVSFNLENSNDFSNLKISSLANKENEKNNKNKDNSNDHGFGRIRLDSELEINLKDDINGKFKLNLDEEYINYINDKEPISKLKLDSFIINDIPLDINSINNKMKNKYIYTFEKNNKTVKKINILYNKANNISYINTIFMKKNKNYIKKEKIKEVIKEIPIQNINIQNSKRLTNNSNNSKKKLINKENDKKIVPIKKQQGTQTKFLDIINDIYFQKEIKEYQIKQLLKYIKRVKQSNFCIKSNQKKNDENISNEKYNNDSIFEKIKKSKYATHTEIIDKNGIPISNNKYFNNKETYDKKNNLILSTRQNIREKMNDHSNNKYYSSSTDKRITNNKPSKELYQTNRDDSIIKINQDSIKIDKNKNLNPQNMKLTIPENINKARDLYLHKEKNNNNNIINLTVDRNKFYPKKYKKYDLNKELYLVDELSTSEDKNNCNNSTDFKDKDKDIKNEYIINRQDLVEKIHQVNQLLNASDINKIKSSIKKKFNSSTITNALFDKNKYNTLIQNNKQKMKYIDIHQKLKSMNNQYSIDDDDNSDNSMIKIKLLNKNKMPTSPYKKTNIISYNKNNINNTSIFNGKNKRVNHYANNSFSFAENNFIKNRKSEVIGYDLSNFLNNELNNLTYNKDQRNLVNNNKIFPSYNKRRLGLYKNYDESNYSNIYDNDINIENKKRGIGNIPLRKYISDLHDYDNILHLNQNNNLD